VAARILATLGRLAASWLTQVNPIPGRPKTLPPTSLQP